MFLFLFSSKSKQTLSFVFLTKYCTKMLNFLLFSPKMQRKKSKASVAMMKVLPNELENQPEFDGFTEWLQTFELYRGKQGVEEFEDEGRVVGKFKVRFI